MLIALFLSAALQASALTADATDLRIPFEEFKALYERGEVLVLDTRGEQSYRAGHIPGARLVPFNQVANHVDALRSETRPIVTYCSWPSEHTSAGAALTLRQAGIRDVRALVGGYGRWVKSGGKVETGEKPGFPGNR